MSCSEEQGNAMQTYCQGWNGDRILTLYVALFTPQYATVELTCMCGFFCMCFFNELQNQK